ncbi:hypothetical protein CYL16_12190 [Mycobacterium sp. EPG1]|nr:hypothetical protein CYL16_12190 [Mycobacterium sp. EPG1]
MVAAPLLGFGWLLVAAGAAFGAYRLQSRNVGWPPDLDELFARARLTVPAPAPAASILQPVAPVIPLRPLTFPEIFSGSWRVMSRNWPTLVGIPTMILLAFAAVLGLFLGIAMKAATASMSTSMFESSDPGGLITGFIGMWIVFMLILAAFALPADALLLGLSVIAADKAVRGHRVRLLEVLAAAKGRIRAVLGLTLCFYGIIFAVDAIAFAIVMAFFLLFPPLGVIALVAVFIASFAVGILFSLAPIVLIVEKRGALDSLKRAAQLSKPAAGRLFGIHSLWAVCVSPLLFIPGAVVSLILGPIGGGLFFAIAFGALIAYFRVLQMLIYTDLRIRQENFETELHAEWSQRPH